MPILNTRFAVGHVVKHALFGYRCVVIDVDASFKGSDDWYEKNAPSRPPKNEPWYVLLVDGSVHHAYVAESQLEPDPSGEPIEHPELEQFFNDFQNGVYTGYNYKKQ